MLSKRTFMFTTLAASGGLLAPLPVLSARKDHPYKDHPFNNLPFTVWIGDWRIELILPFFPELDPDGYPVGEPARYSYMSNGNALNTIMKFAPDDLRRAGDVLIKGGTLAVQVGDRMLEGKVDLNDPNLKTIDLVSSKGQKAGIGAGNGKAGKEQFLSAGATNARIGMSVALGMAAAMNDGKAMGSAVISTMSAAGSASMKVDMKTG